MKDSCIVLDHLKSGSYGHLYRAVKIMFLTHHHTTLALVSFIAGNTPDYAGNHATSLSSAGINCSVFN